MKLISKVFLAFALGTALSVWGLGCTDPDKGGGQGASGQGAHDHSSHQHDGGGIETPAPDGAGENP